jgi:hypothetical protein
MFVGDIMVISWLMQMVRQVMDTAVADAPATYKIRNC